MFQTDKNCFAGNYIVPSSIRLFKFSVRSRQITNAVNDFPHIVPKKASVSQQAAMVFKIPLTKILFIYSVAYRNVKEQSKNISNLKFEYHLRIFKKEERGRNHYSMAQFSWKESSPNRRTCSSQSSKCYVSSIISVFFQTNFN